MEDASPPSLILVYFLEPMHHLDWACDAHTDMLSLALCGVMILVTHPLRRISRRKELTLSEAKHRRRFMLWERCRAETHDVKSWMKILSSTEKTDTGLTVTTYVWIPINPVMMPVYIVRKTSRSLMRKSHGRKNIETEIVGMPDVTMVYPVSDILIPSLDAFSQWVKDECDQTTYNLRITAKVSVNLTPNPSSFQKFETRFFLNQMRHHVALERAPIPFSDEDT